jgi:hypothetical protein
MLEGVSSSEVILAPSPGPWQRSESVPLLVKSLGGKKVGSLISETDRRIFVGGLGWQILSRPRFATLADSWTRLSN